MGGIAVAAARDYPDLTILLMTGHADQRERAHVRRRLTDSCTNSSLHSCGDEAMPYQISPRIQDWVNRGDRAVAELMPLHSAMNDLPGAHRHRRALMLLSNACLGSSGTVLHLVEGLRLWDAELVMRSVVEGTVKFGYLLESPATFTARCIEFSDALPAIAWLRRHSRAAEALKALGGADEADARPFRDLLLSEDELAGIRAAYPREMRKDIERRWGFTALVDAVSKEGGAFGPTARLLLHGYSVASELQHMSHTGTDMPLERDKRSDERRKAIEFAHAAKLVEDCFHFTFLRVIVILRFLKRKTDVLKQVELRHASLIEELEQAAQEWKRIEYPVGLCDDTQD